MPISSFAEKGHQPTMNEVFASVGSKRGLWEKLTRFVSDNYGINQGDFRFYGKNYGWALRFRKSSKALISLYPGKEEFTAQIIIARNEAEKAFNLPLGKNARKTLQDSHELHEGRWLFIRVETDQDASDVQELLIVKSRPAEKQI